MRILLLAAKIGTKCPILNVQQDEVYPYGILLKLVPKLQVSSRYPQFTCLHPRSSVQVCATLVRSEPPSGSGPRVLGASASVSSITIIPDDKPPVAQCRAANYTLPPTSCLVSNVENDLLINNRSYNPNLVDRDTIAFAQTFPDTSGAAAVALDATSHYNLGVTAVSLVAFDPDGAKANCSSTVTVNVSPVCGPPTHEPLNVAETDRHWHANSGHHVDF
jgi:hypothetical protein